MCVFCLYRGGCDFTVVSGCVSNSVEDSLTDQCESVPANRRSVKSKTYCLCLQLNLREVSFLNSMSFNMEINLNIV